MWQSALVTFGASGRWPTRMTSAEVVGVVAALASRGQEALALPLLHHHSRPSFSGEAWRMLVRATCPHMSKEDAVAIAFASSTATSPVVDPAVATSVLIRVTRPTNLTVPSIKLHQGGSSVSQSQRLLGPAKAAEWTVALSLHARLMEQQNFRPDARYHAVLARYCATVTADRKASAGIPKELLAQIVSSLPMPFQSWVQHVARRPNSKRRVDVAETLSLFEALPERAPMLSHIQQVFGVQQGRWDVVLQLMQREGLGASKHAVDLLALTGKWEAALAQRSSLRCSSSYFPTATLARCLMKAGKHQLAQALVMTSFSSKAARLAATPEISRNLPSQTALSLVVAAAEHWEDALKLVQFSTQFGPEQSAAAQRRMHAKVLSLLVAGGKAAMLRDWIRATPAVVEPPPRVAASTAGEGVADRSVVDLFCATDWRKVAQPAVAMHDNVALVFVEELISTQIRMLRLAPGSGNACRVRRLNNLLGELVEARFGKNSSNEHSSGIAVVMAKASIVAQALRHGTPLTEVTKRHARSDPQIVAAIAQQCKYFPEVMATLEAELGTQGAVNADSLSRAAALYVSGALAPDCDTVYAASHRLAEILDVVPLHVVGKVRNDPVALSCALLCGRLDVSRQLILLSADTGSSTSATVAALLHSLQQASPASLKSRQTPSAAAVAIALAALPRHSWKKLPAAFVDGGRFYCITACFREPNRLIRRLRQRTSSHRPVSPQAVHHRLSAWLHRALLGLARSGQAGKALQLLDVASPRLMQRVLRKSPAVVSALLQAMRGEHLQPFCLPHQLAASHPSNASGSEKQHDAPSRAARPPRWLSALQVLQMANGSAEPFHRLIAAGIVEKERELLTPAVRAEALREIFAPIQRSMSDSEGRAAAAASPPMKGAQLRPAAGRRHAEASATRQWLQDWSTVLAPSVSADDATRATIIASPSQTEQPAQRLHLSSGQTFCPSSAPSIVRPPRGGAPSGELQRAVHRLVTTSPPSLVPLVFRVVLGHALGGLQQDLGSPITGSSSSPSVAPCWCLRSEALIVGLLSCLQRPVDMRRVYDAVKCCSAEQRGIRLGRIEKMLAAEGILDPTAIGSYSGPLCS